MNDINRYQELIQKWLRGAISASEKTELSRWYNSFSDDNKEIPDSYVQNEQQLRNRILDKVNASIDVIEHRNTPRHLFTQVRLIAASVVLALVAGVSYFTVIKPALDKETVGLYDIRPIGSSANLTLSDGKVINLDEQQSLIVDGDVKYLDGTTLFDPEAQLNGKISYAVLSTPKGGQYQLRLSDGTEVWLNALSSIRFPSEFDGSRREIELLSGEAYFKVSKQTDKKGNRVPFFVRSDQQSVEVLGTQFNINTYDPRYGVVTTVTEGSVAVTPTKTVERGVKGKALLTAGKQSIVGQTGSLNEKQVDTEEYMAWKEGLFHFNDANIYAVMAEFERWYDIQVTYEISRSDDLFSGYIPKDVSLGEALGLLEITGVNFELTSKNNLIVKQKKDKPTDK
ncbi:FecR family protein [Sphingobacterium pedocola]|uniref:Anti-sigma factor n=1 Tax=Sphingobacterium pedocola TaxID=2082722 RepID=A0ABR9T9K6_9SPHI|nr:FecR domain-containing protein [Sphingobacterium pedocola]MBE8721975.1 hypothetical protein [Sphingobacterium pedocola]